MSALFKAPSISATTFNDTEIKKMALLWQGNSDIDSIEVKQKWREIIGESDARLFLKRLSATIVSRKEHIKKLYKIDPDERDQFEKDMLDTVRALEEAFTYN